MRIEIEFRKIKKMILTVYPPDGRVKVAAPEGTAEDAIRKFVLSKTAFIEKHREKFLRNSAVNVDAENLAVLRVWGESFRMRIIPKSGNPKIVLDGEIAYVYVRTGSSKEVIQGFLDRWYSRALKEKAVAIIKKWEPIIGVEVKKLYARKMKTHWGSCNCQKQTLRLNTGLAKRKIEYLEFVIVHEMIHIIERNHNRNYYRILDKYIPGWKLIRKKLNSGD